MTPAETIRERRGLVATVSTTGTVKPQFSESFANLRSYNDRSNIHNVEYRIFPGSLVEAARDGVVLHALQQNYEWILQIDADAAPFPADALERMLMTAFITHPQVHVIGAYANLKGALNLPTIDTGSGTWEEHYPGEGIIPVIRTGAHFLFAKTEVFRRMGPPWFRTRMTTSPLKAMKELDNFARTKLDGKNPLTDHPEWPTLLAEAVKVSQGSVSTVGEDSGFCDNARSLGVQIVVDTDIIVGHVEDKIIMPTDFAKTVKDRKDLERAVLGVLG
jgi:hypothetical protein